MGLIDEGTENAGKVVDTLRGFPMLLSLVIINLTTFAMVTYLLIEANQTRHAERTQLVTALQSCITRIMGEK